MTFDLAAASAAARAEATNEPFVFTYGSNGSAQTFTLPVSDDWPLSVSGALSAGELERALLLLLGEQWTAFAALTPTFGDVKALFDAYGKWAGVENLPNSSGPRGLVSTPT